MARSRFSLEIIFPRSQSYNLLFHLARWWLVTAFTAWAMVSPPARCWESLRVKETQTGSRPVWATQSITAVASELAGNVSSARKLLLVSVTGGEGRRWLVLPHPSLLQSLHTVLVPLN